ncbi:hypothetical protein GCM10023350_03230 [Nocardioides endophyticus]|uniref:Uncharacterized protein n=1 Tax=Nocardioides endophyticus TaxID=1353775 RepID=A0ABP8Y9L1_9ACTN
MEQNDLLCIADTKLVLGNRYAECVMNGNSLPDFAAMLGICTASYGQTRAFYQHLTVGKDEYAALERGRGPEAIASMELLDAAPQNWEDFILTTWLAETATWCLAAQYLDSTVNLPWTRSSTASRRRSSDSGSRCLFDKPLFPGSTTSGDAGRRCRPSCSRSFASRTRSTHIDSADLRSSAPRY